MCGNCSKAREAAEQMASGMSNADKSREFYRRQGECRERNRIIQRIKAHVCFDALATDEWRCLNHSGKCHQLFLLVQELETCDK